MSYNLNVSGGEKFEFQSKVIFELELSDWHNYSTESAWCEIISPAIVKLKNSPFLAKGVSYEDILNVYEKDSLIFFKSVRESGGHSTYRIIRYDDASDSQFLECWRQLEKLGCTYEDARPALDLIAVDVPPNANIHLVHNILEEGENHEVWSFDEGKFGHALSWKSYLGSWIKK